MILSMLGVGGGGGSGRQSDVPVLRSLGPTYEEELHGRHSRVLLEVLTDKSRDPAKNIALAGHYGSGKSSVILGVQTGLDARKINWVNLSLSSLGIDETKQARIQQDGTRAPLTNLIQKEIVKQLLYRKAPSDMPGSRYVRIDSFRPAPAAAWGAAAAAGFFAIASILGLVDRVADMVPGDFVASHDWLPWAIVFGFALFLGVVFFSCLRVLQSRLRVESVSAGGAAIKLSAKENSYFDEYLDEIVYFFQKTKTQVAIFEDLDRFKDPHIFETLRELNTVLNNAEQIRSRPIRFVYAVRDSIFEQLEVNVHPDDNTEAEAVRASTLETVPSANRTKFFDLVVPMVPFITHRSARDLLVAEFAGSELQPSTGLMNLVGAHLTDMRLIRNIRNEFEIYRASVLGENGLKGLTADRLFAMMVYKNLQLEDFEAIRLGTSKIDKAHKAFRDMVSYQTNYQAAHSKEALDRIASTALWDQQAKAAGEQLQSALSLLQRVVRRGGEPTVDYNGESYELSSLTSAAFWQSLCETRKGVQLVQAGSVTIKLSFDDLVTLLGERVDALGDAVEADKALLRRASRDALKNKDFVAKATMAELMARTDLTIPRGAGVERNLDQIITDLVSPLAHDLLAKGYIDENFTLYCSDYHAIAISASAMNFILHCVQADRADYRFRFDEPASIDAVEMETGARFLDGESIFNLQVFDHYLTTTPERLDIAMEKLIVRVSADPSFVDAYLVDGAAKESFIRKLTPRWDMVFVHLIEKAPLEVGATITLADVAIASAVRDVEYEPSGRVAHFISEHYAEMQAFVGTIEASKATDVATLLSRLGTQVDELAKLGDVQRKAVVAAGLYPVTRANLVMALGDGLELALDVVKAANEDVYSHVLANLEDYLDLLDGDEVTVHAPEDFLTVLEDIATVLPSAVLPVAEGASESCEVGNLEDLDEKAWPPVVSAGRFAPTVWNMTRFTDKFGVPAALAERLHALDLTEPGDVDEESKRDLAYTLTDANDIDANVRVRLVGQLDLAEDLDVERLSDTALNMLPELMVAELVPDSPETYACISRRPFELREKYFAASKNLATYVCELPLSNDDLIQIMKSRHVAPAAKRAITDDADFVRGHLTRNGAVAICDWANLGNEVSVELLVELSRTDVPADHILNLLEPHLPTIELAILDRIMISLGDEYEPLTRRGRHRPKLKDLPGTEELLVRQQPVAI